MQLKVTLVSCLATLTAVGTLTVYAASNPTSATTSNQLATQRASQPANTVGMEPGKPHKHHHRGWSIVRDTARILHMNPSALCKELKSGKSIAQVAASKGVSEEALTTQLRADLQSRLHKAQQNGQLSSEKAQKILARFNTNVQSKLNRKGLVCRQKRQPKQVS